jgi:uncharacterized protein YfaS (alpha-2-macroglobulin family)
MRGCFVCATFKSGLRVAMLLLLVSLTSSAESQPSSQGLLPKADALFKQGRWQEAKSFYNAILDKEKDEYSADALRATQQTILCALELGRWDEAWMRIRHFRRKTVEQANSNSGDYAERKKNPQIGVERLERLRQILEKIAELFAANPALAASEQRRKLTDEQMATDFATVEVLVGAGSPWSYRDRIDADVWWNTKVQEDPGAEEQRGWWAYWSNRDRGVPLAPDGKPLFVAVPASYASNLGTGEKALFLLKEIEHLDQTANKDSAARALLWRALISVRLYGPQTDERWTREQRDYDWSERPYFRKLLPHELSKPFWELADDEARTQVDGRAQILKLPDSESPLALLRRIERDYPKSNILADVCYARGEYCQSRQQFDQALNAYGDLLKNYPRHERAKEAAKQIENIFKPGVLLWSTASVTPGEEPLLSFVCRRTKQIWFTARAIDLAGYYRDVVSKGESGEGSLLDSYGLLPQFSWGLEQEDKKVNKYLKWQEERWSQTVPDSDRLIKGTTRVPLKKAGAYVIEAQAADGKESSRVMLVISDIAIVHRQLRDRSLIYVANARTGHPIADQEVYFFSREHNRGSLGKLKTNKDGIIEKTFKGDRQLHLSALSKAGGIALTSIRVPEYQHASWQEKDELIYAITDRPVYRPGSRVHFRLYVHRSVERRYQPPRADEPVQVSIIGPRYNTVKILKLRSDSFGGVSGEFDLNPEAAQGEYSIRVDPQYRWGTQGSFRVESYKKPEFEVTVQPAGLIRPGEKGRVRIQARYLFGGPVAGGRVRYQIHRADGATGSPVPHEFDWLYGRGYADNSRSYAWLGGQEQAPSFTDEERYGSLELEEYEHGKGLLVRRGEAHLGEQGAVDIEIDTVPNVNQRFTIEVEVRDASRRTVRGQGEVLVVGRDLQVNVELDRGWYQPGMKGAVKITARSATGSGAAVRGTLLVERITYAGRTHAQAGFETVSKEEIGTDAAGACLARLPSLTEGQYRASFQTTDSRNQRVSANAVFWVHGPKFLGKDYRLVNLEIIPDRTTYAVGDVAHLLVHVAQPNTRILFSDDIREGWLQTHRFIDIVNHVAVIDIPIEERYVPNFFVGATAVGNGRVTSDTCEVLVPPGNDLLQVRLQSNKQVYRPGEQAEVRVALSNAGGKPSAGQITLAVYDKAVTYIQNDTTPQPTVLLQQARLRRFAGFAEMQEDEKFRPTGSLVCPEYEIGGGRHLPMAIGGAPGGGGGTPDIQEQVAELVHPGFKGSRARLDEVRSSRDIDPAVRQDFADTALWRAAVDIGVDGAAKVSFALPDSLTTWRLRGYALSRSAQTGEAAAEITTSKNLLVRLQTPRFLVEGDEVVLSANVHNALKSDKRVTAELVVPAALLQSTNGAAKEMKPDAKGNALLRTQLVVTSGSTQRFDWPCKALRSGLAAITVKALTDEESDAMQLPVPILARGSLKEEARTGSFVKDKEETQSFPFTLPAKMEPGTAELDLRVSPGPVGVMLDALPFLIQYPYGCTEQTMSRFYPTIIAADALKRLGTDLEAIGKTRHAKESEKLADRFQVESLPIFDSAEMRRMAQTGLDRLYKFRHEDWGWGWWEHDASSPYMTAYVLMGLVAAEKAGFAVEADVIKFGYAYLGRLVQKETLEPPGGVSTETWETQAFLAYVLSLDTASKPEKMDYLDNVSFKLIARKHRALLSQHAQRLGPYGKALLTLAFQNAGEAEQARNVLRSLLLAVARDDQKGTAWIRASGGEYWRWWNSDVETTSWTLRAILRVDPDNELAPRFVKWLVEQRWGGHFWRSTRDTALAVAALADFVVLRKAELADCRIEISLDGEPCRVMTLTRDNFLAADHCLVLESKRLPPGTHRLALKKSGRGEVNFSSRLRYRTKQEVFPASGQGIVVKREYYRVDRDGGSKRVPLKESDELAVGDVLETVLTVKADHSYEYLAFEDMKPAGCEPTQLQSGEAWFGSQWTTLELRDDRVLFFVQHLNAGEHQFRYGLRAEAPGRFLALPANGFAMYNPEIRANSDGKRIRIVESK